jgi:hypothetical protein
MSETTHRLYQPSAVTGSEFTRCYQVVIDNREGAPPVTTFFEERVLVGEGAPTRRWPVGHCAAVLDPAAEIPVLDPATGASAGATITMAALYGLLYSAYLWAATARDAAGMAALEPDGGEA